MADKKKSKVRSVGATASTYEKTTKSEDLIPDEPPAGSLIKGQKDPAISKKDAKELKRTRSKSNSEKLSKKEEKELKKSTSKTGKPDKKKKKKGETSGTAQSPPKEDKKGKKKEKKK